MVAQMIRLMYWYLPIAPTLSSKLQNILCEASSSTLPFIIFLLLKSNRLNKFNMYNLFQYINEKQLAQHQLKKNEANSAFILKHEEFKKTAYQNLKNRAQEFLINQATSQQPFIFEDDHYSRWRKHRLYKDIQDPNKFKGFKTFRHRPNEDMDKFYTSRQRREIANLAAQKEALVQSGTLQKEHLSRSQRSQGPYGAKISFRVTKKDEEYLQPRLRFSNVTDKQRMNESAMNFDERVDNIYRRFEESKSRLGKKIRQSMERYNDESIPLSQSNTKKSQSLSKKPSGVQQDPQESLMCSTKLSEYYQERNQARRKSKAYFKLSKTMQMFHPDEQRKAEFDAFLKRSQFDRKKDLSNIRGNTHNQNYIKSPIF